MKGSIIHILRENETSYTTTLRSEFSDGNLQVTAASFHPEIQDILLAGYGYHSITKNTTFDTSVSNTLNFN